MRTLANVLREQFRRTILTPAGADPLISARMVFVQFRPCSAAVLPSCEPRQAAGGALTTTAIKQQPWAHSGRGLRSRTKSLGSVSAPASSSMPTQASFPIFEAHISAVVCFYSAAGTLQ